MSQVIRFNEPQEITLKFDEGREVTGQYGPQLMFSTVDGSSFYLDQNCPAVLQMRELGVRAGVPIRIAKTGSGKFTKWTVERLDPPPSSSNGSARLASQNAPSSVVQMLASTNNRQSDVTAPAPQSPHVALSSQLLAGCLVAAIDATLIAESYATSKSAKISFTPEDIRAMGLTLYIQHAKTLESFHRESREQAQGGATWRQ